MKGTRQARRSRRRGGSSWRIIALWLKHSSAGVRKGVRRRLLRIPAGYYTALLFFSLLNLFSLRVLFLTVGWAEAASTVSWWGLPPVLLFIYPLWFWRDMEACRMRGEFGTDR